MFPLALFPSLHFLLIVFEPRNVSCFTNNLIDPSHSSHPLLLLSFQCCNYLETNKPNCCTRSFLTMDWNRVRGRKEKRAKTEKRVIKVNVEEGVKRFVFLDSFLLVFEHHWLIHSRQRMREVKLGSYKLMQ